MTSRGQLKYQIAKIKKLQIGREPATGQVTRIESMLQLSFPEERTIICSPGKREAEDLSAYLNEQGFKTKYFHSDLAPRYKREIAKEFREGSIKAVIVVSTLVGLSRPTKIFILDADKKYRTRNAKSLAHLASFSTNYVCIFADTITPAISKVFKTLC